MSALGGHRPPLQKVMETRRALVQTVIEDYFQKPSQIFTNVNEDVS